MNYIDLFTDLLLENQIFLFKSLYAVQNSSYLSHTVIFELKILVFVYLHFFFTVLIFFAQLNIFRGDKLYFLVVLLNQLNLFLFLILVGIFETTILMLKLFIFAFKLLNFLLQQLIVLFTLFKLFFQFLYFKMRLFKYFLFLRIYQLLFIRPLLFACLKLTVYLCFFFFQLIYLYLHIFESILIQFLFCIAFLHFLLMVSDQLLYLLLQHFYRLITLYELKLNLLMVILQLCNCFLFISDLLRQCLILQLQIAIILCQTLHLRLKTCDHLILLFQLSIDFNQNLLIFTFVRFQQHFLSFLLFFFYFLNLTLEPFASLDALIFLINCLLIFPIYLALQRIKQNLFNYLLGSQIKQMFCLFTALQGFEQLITQNNRIKSLRKRLQLHFFLTDIVITIQSIKKVYFQIDFFTSQQQQKHYIIMNFQDISLEWRNQNHHIKEMSLPISLSEFGFYKEERSLSSEFKILTFMTQTQYHLEKLYQNPQQFPYNRNPHIMTYNPTKPILTSEQEKDKIENYINANIIDFNGKKIIATQGPLTSTFYNLYRMIEKYNITSIFMLCCLIQKNKKKCDRYWPNLETEGGKMSQKQYEITLDQEKKQDELRTRKIRLRNTINNFEVVVTQYQFITWPDGDRPLESSKKTIDFLVKEFVKHYDKGQPPLVHCSAGVGRTGTFIAMGIFRKLIQEQNEVSVFETVRLLREQRWGMVYTFSQYEYLYEYVDQLIMEKKNKELGNDDSNSSQDGNNFSD